MNQGAIFSFPARDIENVKVFYEKVMGWKFKKKVIMSKMYSGEIYVISIPGNLKTSFSGFII